MVKVPKLKKTLAERIMAEAQVFTMLAKEANPRNHALLRLLYASGIRVSEICDLCWEDVQPRGDSGQITVFGKGEKTRMVLLTPDTYSELLTLHNDAAPGAPIFRSRGGASGKAGRKLDPSQVTRIVEAAACRAGIAVYTETVIVEGKQVQRKRSRVSPHWLRHAHASHALDNGASIAVVKETLGHESIETTAGYTHVRPGISSAQYLKIYANCFTDVRLAICATWYNLYTFENLCKELEEQVEGVTKTHAINSQLHMNIGGSAQKLCFEYEHFMFHQKMTVDRITFFLSGFFKQQQGNIFTIRDFVVRHYSKRPDDPKLPHALAINVVVSKYHSFLASIHSSMQGRGQTERDILSWFHSKNAKRI